MKLHKINVENSYRNAVDQAIAVLAGIPVGTFASRPEASRIALRYNAGESTGLVLPSWSTLTVDLSAAKPSWAPKELTGTLTATMSSSVGGLTSSGDIDLGEVEVYSARGTSTGRIFDVTEGVYTILLSIQVEDGQGNVLYRRNSQAAKVAVTKNADTGPETTLDVGGAGGAAGEVRSPDGRTIVSVTDDSELVLEKNAEIDPSDPLSSLLDALGLEPTATLDDAREALGLPDTATLAEAIEAASVHETFATKAFAKDYADAAAAGAKGYDLYLPPRQTIGGKYAWMLKDNAVNYIPQYGENNAYLVLPEHKDGKCSNLYVYMNIGYAPTGSTFTARTYPGTADAMVLIGKIALVTPTDLKQGHNMLQYIEVNPREYAQLTLAKPA